jgi:hypothetical protein
MPATCDLYLCRRISDQFYRIAVTLKLIAELIHKQLQDFNHRIPTKISFISMNSITPDY